jgi:catalase
VVYAEGVGAFGFFEATADVSELTRAMVFTKADGPKDRPGIQNLTDAEAAAMAAEDPDSHLRDLYTAIDGGDSPSWTVYVQVMPYEDAAGYRFNPFDLTKVWPHGDYPLQPVGRIVLNSGVSSQIDSAGPSPVGGMG